MWHNCLLTCDIRNLSLATTQTSKHHPMCQARQQVMLQWCAPFFEDYLQHKGTRGTPEWCPRLVAPLVGDPNDPSVNEGPGCWEHLRPTENKSRRGKAISYYSLWHGIQILEYSMTTQLKVRARRYGNLVGVLPGDNAMQQQWLRSGAWDYWGWNKHNFLKTCQNEEFIGTMEREWCQSGHL